MYENALEIGHDIIFIKFVCKKATIIKVISIIMSLEFPYIDV